MFNKVILAGNLTRDIELRFAGNNLAVAKTAIATSKKSRGQDGQQKEEVMFIDITAFGRTAEVMNQYLKKGSKVLLEGRLVFEQWTAQDGSNRSKHALRVDTMKMLDSKSDSSHSHQNSGSDSSPSHQNSHYQEPAQEKVPEIDIDDDEIPFSQG